MAVQDTLDLFSLLQDDGVDRFVVVALLPLDDFAGALRADKFFHRLPLEQANGDMKIAATYFAVAFGDSDFQVRKGSMKILEESGIIHAKAVCEDPMSLLVDVGGECQVVVVKEAQIQS